MEQNKPNSAGSNQKRSKSKSSRKNKNKSEFQNSHVHQNSSHPGQTSNKKHPKSEKISQKKIDFKSISNMAVQTPMAWNLRDYNNEKPKRPLSRSASVSNLQPRRVPFANYGWATKTKDLSLKPTHNALANKVKFLTKSKNYILIHFANVFFCYLDISKAFSRQRCHS